MTRIMKENLTEQLNLCVVISSRHILFSNVPLTFKFVCPILAKGEVRITDTVEKTRSFDKLSDSGNNNNENNTNNNKHQGNKNNNNNNNNNNSGCTNNNNGNQKKVNNDNDTKKRPEFKGSIIKIRKKLLLVDHHVFLKILYFLLDITKVISHLW